jgi:hypothetical protein
MLNGIAKVANFIANLHQHFIAGPGLKSVLKKHCLLWNCDLYGTIIITRHDTAPYMVSRIPENWIPGGWFQPISLATGSESDASFIPTS